MLQGMELNLKPTDLIKITKKTIEEFSFLAKAKNCELSFEIPDKLPLLNIDTVKIKQVIVNLISNAINYHEKKGEIKVSLVKKGNNVVFCCKDKGIGISKQEQSKIFTRFHRSEKAMAVIPAGSGLGLFISKAIIEKSKGKIWFDSKKGKGSTFCFSLPVKK